LFFTIVIEQFSRTKSWVLNFEEVLNQGSNTIVVLREYRLEYREVIPTDIEFHYLTEPFYRRFH